MVRASSIVNTQDAVEGLIMFVDIAGSTQLYKQHGDLVAYAQISTCLAQLGDIVGRFGGVVIKHIGDEVLCLFDSVVCGLRAAVVVQIEICTAATNSLLPVRIGCHFGPVLVRNNDLFGDTVNIAAHLASLAKAQQILTSQSTLAQYEEIKKDHSVDYQLHRFLDFDQPLQSREFNGFIAKNKGPKVDVLVVQWELFLDEIIADWTFVQPLPNAQHCPVFYMKNGSQVFKMERIDEYLTVGRTEAAHICIQNRNVSRLHGSFELDAGRVKYIDQSSNGTYVRQGTSEVAFIHRESILLTGHGVLSFGVSFDQTTVAPFQYWFE